MDSLIRKKAKCAEAVNAIILLMRKNGIPLPSKYQKSRVHEDLPGTPNSKAEEIVRRFRYLEPACREHIADRLNDLLVYAEVAKELRSELIAIIVLSKLRKWENLLLHPEHEMPPIPSPSPETKRRLLERKRNIEERDRRIAEIVKQYEEQGENRRANIQTINPFAENVRTITLPPQTLEMQGATAARVDLDERRRRDIEDYERFGAVRRQLHFLPEHERNIKGPKLPDHGLPPTTSRNIDSADTQYPYRELGERKRMDQLKRQLHETVPSVIRNPSNNPEQPPTPSPERKRRLLEQKQAIEERDRRIASLIRQYEEQGQNRRAAVQTIKPFDSNVRTITLPPQTIPSPNSQTQDATAARINLEEQRRRDIENYKKFGAIKKRLHDMPEYQHDKLHLMAPKLPPHGLAGPSTSPSQNVDQDRPQSRYKNLEKQREEDRLKRQLQEALITSRRRIQGNDPHNSPEHSPENDPDNGR